jgi:predicted acyltransferase
VCFFILRLDSHWKQAVAAAAVMALNWGLYVVFPGPSGPFDYINNVGIRLDRALLGMDHVYYWRTMNFLDSGVTVLFGAWASQLMRNNREVSRLLTY